MAGLTPKDSIFGEKAQTESKSPSKVGVGSSPLCHTANQPKFGKTAPGIRFSAIRFKDGFAESVADASQTPKTYRKLRIRLNMVKQLKGSH